MTLTLFTIGVYGWEPERFFAALQAAGIDTFCDIRARRRPVRPRAPRSTTRTKPHTRRVACVPNSAPRLSNRTSASD